MLHRATTTSRGYGAKHQQLRRQWEPKVRAGNVDCSRCEQPIEPDAAWDLGHSDDRTTWTGPEHLACNRGAGGVNGAAVTNAQRLGVSRAW